MSFAETYSKAAPLFTVRVSKPTYTNLADLFREYGTDHVFPVAGIYINNKGKYGPQPSAAISESLVVNLPPHLLDICETMRKDPEAVDAINDGKAGFKVYQYTTKSGKLCYSVNWVDIK